MSDFQTPPDLKIILLGDSAVGKSKLIERFLLNDYEPHQLSTYALTLYRYTCAHPSKRDQSLTVEFWDTAGQERFQAMHPSYYTGAHACLLCFDMTRKVTYKNLDAWYDSLLACRGPRVPVVVVANKVDMEPARARTSFAFVERRRAERRAARRRTAADAGAATDDDDDDDDDDRDRDRDHGDEDMPLFLCSASDGTNVVAAFRDAIKRAAAFKDGGEVGAAFVDEVLSFIREEEASADGLFARDCQRAAAASYASGLDSLDKRFDSSNFSLGDDQSTLRDSHAGSQSLFSQASITRSLESTSNNNVCDSESEDEVQKQKSLARVLELRKANLVVQ